LNRRLAPRKTFDIAQIAALGPAPAPPLRTSARGHHGKVHGVTIWTEPIKERLRRAHAIGSREGVVAAFPGWDPVALNCAIVRYVGATGEPTPFDPQDFRRRLEAIDLDQLLDRVGSLLTWGPLRTRETSATEGRFA
jgi:hypothetical protein